MKKRKKLIACIEEEENEWRGPTKSRDKKELGLLGQRKADSGIPKVDEGRLLALYRQLVPATYLLFRLAESGLELQRFPALLDVSLTVNSRLRMLYLVRAVHTKAGQALTDLHKGHFQLW